MKEKEKNLICGNTRMGHTWESVGSPNSGVAKCINCNFRKYLFGKNREKSIEQLENN